MRLSSYDARRMHTSILIEIKTYAYLTSVLGLAAVSGVFLNTLYSDYPEWCQHNSIMITACISTLCLSFACCTAWISLVS